jgi:hypothetical protein
MFEKPSFAQLDVKLTGVCVYIRWSFSSAIAKEIPSLASALISILTNESAALITTSFQ